ncbi:hypothetical protein AURDEDRAFT_172596 [Auricularia subglabra TFB-10046 SS5]|nr:hypothetical protein AURDEDRAFT_172596 [Auricularia subglabra TFB-10046 SS5]
MTGHRRALLFFHHILSSKKKAFIRDEGRALGVSGLCKVGYPGVLVVQGPDERVQEYVSRVKRLRWQSCTVNANDPLAESELATTFKDRVRELDELKALGREMELAGWTPWWRKAMGFRG